MFYAKTYKDIAYVTIHANSFEPWLYVSTVHKPQVDILVSQVDTPELQLMTKVGVVLLEILGLLVPPQVNRSYVRVKLGSTW